MRSFLGIFCCILLVGCATGIPTAKYNDLPASPKDFSVCHGYSCTYKSKAGFTDAQWREIGQIFRAKPARDAAAEHSKIARAIALMERFTGQKTGTDEDDPEAVGFKTSTKQMDCIDETVNTSMYLTFLQKEGLLKFHERAEPTHRGYLIDGRWPHNTAVIREKAGGALFVVDSFYRKNGEEPYIMPREAWLAGWKPPGSKQ